MSAALRANPRWLLAERDGGIVLVGPATDIDLDVEGSAEQVSRLAAVLAAGTDAAALARAVGWTDADAAQLIEALAGRGALVAAAPPSPATGVSLGDALLAGAAPSLVWTAQEALLLPGDSPPELAREALRRFACGLPSGARLRAYAHALRAGRATTFGDAPDPALLAQAVARAHAGAPAAIHVLDLAANGVGGATRDARIDPSSLLELGALTPHRLGAILAITAGETQDGRTLVTARRASPSLRVIGHPDARHSRGSAAEPELAALKARAEAAERYVLEDPGCLPLVRGRASELPGAIAPQAIVAYSARQLAARGGPAGDEDPQLLWAPVRTAAGAPRLAPAGAVLLACDGPTGVALSSSGAAAHTDPARARELALAELIERDAFMRTWLGHVSRELVERASLPAGVQALLQAVEARGVRAALVNISLESWPVILCVLHGDRRLVLGAACRRSSADAASAAAEEAASALRLAPLPELAPIVPAAVRTPLDHFRLYQQRERIAEAAFLWSSPEHIALAQVPEPDADASDLLAAVGETSFAELHDRRVRPFVVVRAVLPGLVPITFGHDREPLGLARLREPLRTADGRSIDGFPMLERAMMPHPFP